MPLVRKMVDKMHHRGPDDSGTYTDGHVNLGMSRLAIIDVSPAGHQPMCTPDELIWIVYNGEVYNFQSERKLLETQGIKFRSNSDTEVILHLYERYGDDFLLRLRGMFALAIYDKRKGTGREKLLLARDHLGIKPLLYAISGSRLVFASEMKALLSSGLVDPQIDPESLRLLLTFGSIYQPNTMLKNVRMLLPAHRLVIERGQMREERYWSLGLNRSPELRHLSYCEQVDALSDALNEIVRMQMVSDVPLGAFLSGGVDSSILVAMMAHEAGRRIKTFSVGFGKEGAAIDESEDARRTAEFLGTDHTHVLVQGDDLRDSLFDIASSLDQPTVDGVNAYFVSRAARQGMTVAISGTGGDELFAGYPWFMSMAHNRDPFWGAGLLAAITSRPMFDPLISGYLGYWLYRMRNLAGFLGRFATQYQIFGALGALKALSPELRHLARAGRAERFDLQAIDELHDGTAVERVTGLCLRGYTNNQLLRDIDTAGMSHSLEIRVPYLDPVLVDLALSLPDETKLDLSASVQTDSTYRATGAKRILIDVGQPLLPKGFDLQPKQGFSMPFAEWMKRSVKDIFLDALAEDTVRKRGWLNPNRVTNIKEDFMAGRLSWAQPWLLMMVELWASQVLDRKQEVIH